MKHRFGLKSRFIGLILALLAVIFGVIVLVLVQNNTGALRQDLYARSNAFAALATKPIGSTYLTYQDTGTVLISKQINNFTSLDANVINVSIVDGSGAIRYKLADNVAPVSAGDAASFVPVYIYTKAHTLNRIIYPYVEDGGLHRYAVVYDISSAAIDEAIARLVRSILLYSGIGLIVSAVVTYLLVNWLFLNPIKLLRDKALIISSGQYAQAIPHDRNDEIGDLAVSVNQMADNLKADINKLKEVDQIKSEFMMIASHNLRTPLTLINGYLDMVKTQALSQELRRMLSSIEANSQRLGIFAEDLLIISSIEDGQKIFTPERMELNSTVKGIADEFATLTKDKKISLKVDIQKTVIEIMGSKPHLRGAIWNLLENALKFTEPKGKIGLSVKQVGDNVQISISDTGTGISPEEVAKLFTKFHRGTSTLVYDYEGNGIGLYVTKLIIKEHAGTIAVDSTVGIGSTFTVILPVAQAEAKKS